MFIYITVHSITKKVSTFILLTSILIIDYVTVRKYSKGMKND